MRIHAVINARAGTVLGSDPEVLRNSIRQALVDAGHEATVELAAPVDLPHALARAAGMGLDALIAGGGDGTVRTAASLLKDSSTALGILPLGTLNRLARDLGIPVDATAAVDTLAHATIRAIDVAEINGRIFLCNSLIGLPLIYSEERQRLRGEPLGQRIRGYVRVVRELLRTRHKIEITVDDGAAERRFRAITIAVSNNSYAETPSLMFTRPALDQGHLGIYIARHPSGWALARAALRALAGRWRQDPHLDHSIAHKIVINAHRSSIRVSNDGEVEIMKMPLVYRIHPGSLKVLAPAQQRVTGEV